MRLPNLVPPVPPPDGDHGKLRQYDAAADGGGDFLTALHAETDVAVVVSDDDESLEPGSLTGPSLLLDRHDLHHLVLERGSHEGVDDLVLLDGERVKVDLLQAADFPIPH